jgi:hypothetical protein
MDLLPKNIKDDIWNYCRANNITNMDKFIVDMVIQGLNIEKYGTSPITPQVIEKEVIKEVIKEVVKEVHVPVEKIIEKIVEVPIEKIVKVPVEKIVEKLITDDSQIKELLDKISELEKKLKNSENKSSKVSEKKEKDLLEKIKKLEDDLELEKNKTSNSGLEKLYNKINNLESLLELERNRNKFKKEEVEKPFNDKPKSSINWIPKEERNKDIYGES